MDERTLTYRFWVWNPTADEIQVFQTENRAVYLIMLERFQKMMAHYIVYFKGDGYTEWMLHDNSGEEKIAKMREAGKNIAFKHLDDDMVLRLKQEG